MTNNWLRIVAGSYWHSLTLAAMVWGALGVFTILLGLVSVDFRMPLPDSFLALAVGLLGCFFSSSRSSRLRLSHLPVLLRLVGLSLIVAGSLDLILAFQSNLYVFRGVLVICVGLGCFLLPFYTGKDSFRRDGSWLWTMLLLYLLASIWWLYALNQTLKGESVLQDSVPGIILVGHFVILTMLYICRDIVFQFYVMESERDKALEHLSRSQQHYRSLFDHNYTELEHVNGELENFAAVASHDLQEPLRKIVRFGELLQQAELPEKEVDYLKRMVSASRRMQQLIHEILELARLGKDSMNVQPVDLSSIAQAVIKEHKAKLSVIGAQTEVSLKHSVDADPKLIKRVFDNLVTNAIKYSRKDRKLKIALYSQLISADNVAVYFSDNGIGIDASHHQAVFKPFKRLHSRSEVAGTGMGLAIVKKIVDLHHGSVVLSSQIGEGTTIKLMLPRRSELG
ncbi:MAG: hypothetical protein LC639_02270 [Idiomarina sp.]|nr:hypothetical protein [Idiomarina sp.]